MGVEIDRLEIEAEVAARNANKQLDLMIEKLSKVSKTLGGINFGNLESLSKSANQAKSFSNSMSVFATHTGSSNRQVKQLTSSLNGYISKATLATNKSRKLSQMFGSFYTSFLPVIKGVKSLGKAIDSSMDYIETYNYFNVTMGKIGKEFSSQYEKYGYESAKSYINSFSSRLNNLTKKMTGYSVGDNGVLTLSNDMNLGLDPNQLMNYQASVAAVTNSLGLCGETSVNTSKALSMLAADLSSFKNVDIKTVMTNMQSGLIGQSRALYKYGIDITNATLQTYAYKYGLSTAVSEMTQADKMQLRLLAILDQSKIAWGDQANTINSVANQYRIFKQQVQNVARMIGNVLMPVIKAVLPFVNGLLIATQRFIGFIGGLLGIDFGKNMDGISSGYSGFDTGDMADDTESMADGSKDLADNLGKASENAKKMKSAMLGIDELNVISQDDDSTSGSDSARSSAGSGGIDLSNEIAAALANYEAVWNAAFKNSVNNAQQYADKICNIFSNMWGMIKSEDYEELGEYIAGGVDLVFEKINSVFNWSKTGSGIAEFVDGYCRTINSIVDNVNWRNIGKTIGDGFNVITNSMYLYLTGIDWVSLGEAFAIGLNGMVDSVDWLTLGQTIGAWIMKIPKIVYGFVTNLNWDEVGVAVGNSINGILVEFDGKTIAGGINGIVNGILIALKEAIKTVDWGDVAKAVGDVLGNLDWGTLAGIGLALGAVKLAGVLGGLLSIVLSESIKEALKAGLNKILPKIGTLLSNTKIGEVISLTTGGAGTLSESIVTVFGASIPTIATVVGGISLVVAGIIDLWNTSETFRDNVSNMLSIIGGAFLEFKKKAWDEGLKPLWDSISEFFGSLYEIYESSGLKDIFEAVITTIGYIASGAIGGLIVAVGNLIKFLSGIVKNVIALLNTVLAAVQSFIKDHEKLFGGLQKIFGGFTEFLAGIFSGDWERALDGIKIMVSGFKDTIQETFGKLWKKIKSIFDPDTVKRHFKKAFEYAYDAVTKIWDGIKDYFVKVAGWIIDPIEKAVNGVRDAINWVFRAVGADEPFKGKWKFEGFASGSNGLPSDTIGIVNDQVGSTYKELIVPPHGKPFIPEGRNVMLPMEKGTKIMPAGQTKALMNGMPKFKNGIGEFFGNAWAKIKDFTGDVMDYIEHPSKILQIAIDKFSDFAGITKFFVPLATGAINKVFDSAVKFISNMFEKTGGTGIEKAVNWAVAIANDNSHGYDQAGRWGKPDYDCSSLVISAFEQAGIKLKSAGATYTGNMYPAARQVGFADVTGNTNRSTGEGLQRGDILLNRKNHVALYLGNGRLVQASINEFGKVRGGKPGDQTGREIYTRAYYNYPWDNILRYVGKAYEKGIGKIGFKDVFKDIPELANGGVLRSGQMFIARERGPELIGGYNGHTGVMNNDQIVRSVSNGVEAAFERQNATTNSLLREVVEYQKMLLNKELSVNIDGKKADKQLSKARKNSGYSFSPA